MKNSNTVSTTQRSIIARIAFLLSCAIAYNVIFITTTMHAWDWPSLPRPSWPSWSKPPEQQNEQPMPISPMPQPQPAHQVLLPLQQLKLLLQQQLPDKQLPAQMQLLKLKIVPNQQLFAMPSPSTTKEFLVAQITKLLPLTVAPAPPGLLLEPMSYAPPQNPSMPIGYCSQLRAITIRVLQYLQATIPRDDTNDQIFNIIKRSLQELARTLEIIEQKKTEQNIIKNVLNNKQWSNIPIDQEIELYLAKNYTKINQPAFFGDLNLPIAQLRIAANILNKQHSFLIPAKRNARDVVNAFVTLLRGPNFMQYQIEYLIYYCVFPPYDPRCNNPPQPTPPR